MSLLGQAQAQTNIYWDTAAGGGIGGSGNFSSTGVSWATNPLGASVASGGPGGDALFNITNAANGISAVASGNYALNFGGAAGSVTNGGSFQSWGINMLSGGYVFTIDGTGANTRTLTMTNALDLGTNTVTFANGARGTNTYILAGPATTGWAGGIAASAGAGIVIANTNPSNLTNFGFYMNSGGSVSANAPITILTLANTRVMLGSQNSGGGNFNSAIANNSAGGSPLELTNSSSGTLAFNGVISGTNGIAINNSAGGKIALTASNTYSGGTTVNGTGTGQINLSNSSALGSGALTVAGAGTNYIRAAGNNLNFTNDVVINPGSTLRLASTNSAYRSTWSGTIGGGGGIYYAFGDSGLYLTGTNSSFGGGVNNGSSGAIFVTSLGMAGSGSSIGTNGTITLSSDSGTSGAGTIQWLSASSEASDKTFALSAVSSSVNQGVKIYAGDSVQGGTNVTLTLNGNINSTSTNNKVITLGAYNGNTLVVNGSINQTASYTNSVVVSAVANGGTVVLANTNNSFSGSVSISSGASSTNALQVSQIGNSGANSPLGRNGTINIGGSSSTGLNILQYTGAGETTDKVINLAGTFGGATLDQSGSGNLKFTSALTASGLGAKTLALQGSAAGTGELAANIGDLGGNAISLSKSGSGTWTLSGSNSYSGATTVLAGTLRLGQVSALPSGGVLLGSSSVANASTLELAVAGAYTLGSLGDTNAAAGYINFTNSSGSAATLTFTGGTNVITVGGNGGRSVANNSANLALVFNGAVDISSSANNDVSFGGAGNTAIAGPVFNTNTGIRGLTKTGAGTLILAADASYNGTTTVSGGVLQVGNGGTAGALGTNSVSNNAALAFNRSDSYTVASAISGSGSLAKLGSGTLVLSGTSTYAGATAVTAGALVVNGNNSGATGAVTIAAGAMLAGTGTLGGATTISGIHSPGNSPGVQTFGSGLIYETGAILVWELNANTDSGRGIAFDGVDVTGGTLTINTGVTSELKFNGSGSSVVWSDAFWDTSRTWLVFSNANAPALASGSVFDTVNVGLDSNGASLATARPGATFSWQSIGNDLYASYAIPEPSTYALIAFAGGACFLLRKRLRRG